MTDAAKLRVLVGVEGAADAAADIQSVGTATKSTGKEMADASRTVGEALQTLPNAAKVSVAETTAVIGRVPAEVSAAAATTAVAARKVGNTFQALPNAAQVSVGQTAAAWRQLPMQLQDVAVSLAGGMNPLMVAMQQGPQITSSFGGVRATVMALGAAISPVALAASALAVGLGAASIAAYQGSQEMGTYERSLINTGNRIGLTSGRLAEMADRMGQLKGVTEGQAADALALLAGTAGITRDRIEAITTTALRLEAAGGPAVAETAKAFAELAKAPLEASIKLHEQYGYLTESVYQQIKALEEQGRRTEAAKLAQEAYHSAMQQRIPQLAQNLGTLEKAWKAVADGAKWAWDKMLNVGREDAPAQRLEALRKQIAASEAADTRGVSESRLAVRRQYIQGLKDEAMALEETIRLSQRSAQAQSAAVQATDAAIARDKAKKPAAGPKGREGDPFAADRAAAAEWAKSLMEFRRAGADAEAQVDDLTKSQGLLVKVLKSPEFAQASEPARELLLADAYAAISAEQHAEARKQLARITAEGARAHEQWITSLDRSAQSVAQQVQALQDEEQAEALVTARKISLAQAIQLVAVERLREQQVQMMGDEQAVLALQKEIDLRLRLAGLAQGKADRTQSTKDAEDAARAYERFMQRDIGADLAAGFDRASQSLGQFVQTFGRMTDLQEEYAAAVRGAAGDSAKLAAADQRYARAQLNHYASMAGSAKGFFREGSKGYKALQAAEQTFRAFELAQAVANAAKQIGLFGAVASSKVAADQVSAASSVTAATVDAAASQVAGTAAASAAVAGQAAKGDPYSAWARMAAMAAAMAALGFAVSGGSGSGGSRSSYVTGSGTTLGDRDAASTSIADSIDRLTEVDTLTMQYSGQMLAALRSIDAGINGLGSQVLRDIGAGYGSDLATDRGTLMSLGANLMGLVFTQARSQTVGEIRTSGLALQDTQATNNAWQATWSATRNRRSADAAAAAALSPYADDFEAVILRIADSMQAAAGPLGVSADQVAANLASATVQLDAIVTRDKSGEEIAAAIAAQLSKAGDQIAAQVLPGLERFQVVGEAYYETVTRVASGVEEARAALAPLNLAMAELATVAGGADDVGAELVRNSIAARESTAGVLSSVGRLVDGLDGSAAELAESYAELVDARRTLGALGVQASALTTGLLAAAGGLDGLSDSLSAYSDWALTDGERLALSTQALREQFAGLGLSLPETVADYRALVAGIDTSGEAGQRLLGQVLGLADGYGELASAQQAVADERAGLEEQLLQLQGDTAALRARELDGLDASNRALQQRIWALEDEQEAAEELARAGQSVAAFISDLRGASGSTASISARRATYATDLAAAQAGDADATTRVVASARSLVEAIKSSATDPIQLARDTARIAAQLQALPATAAYQAQQAAEAAASTSAPGSVPAAATTAATSPLVPTSGAAPAVATGPTESQWAALLAEVAALRKELAEMRTEQRSRGDAIADSTAKSFRILDAVSAGGDSFAVTSA